MRRFWDGLQSRERYVLMGAVLILLLLLAYLLAIEPWLQRNQQLRDGIAVQRETLQWMNEAATEIGLLRRNGTGTAGTGQSLMAVIDASTRQAGLAQAVRQLRPDSQGVSVRLEDASFDDMVRWLGRLYQQNGITVSHLTMEPQAESGRVHANVMLMGGES